MVKMGLKNDEYVEKLKALKENDLLYSAYYDESTETVESDAYLFKEYVKAPPKKTGDTSGVWARLTHAVVEGNKVTPLKVQHTAPDGTKTESDDNIVTDLTYGVFLTENEAFKAIEEQFLKMYNAAKNAVK